MSELVGIIINSTFVNKSGGPKTFLDNLNKLLFNKVFIAEKTVKSYFSVNPENINQSKTNDFGQFLDHLDWISIKNVENAILTAYKTHLITHIHVTEYPHLYSVLNTDLDIKMSIITHNDFIFPKSNKFNKYTDFMTEQYRNLLKYKNIEVITSSKYNQNELKKIGIDTIVMPLPIFTSIQIEQPNKNGMIITGRYDHRKNYELFIKVASEYNIPATMIISTKNEDKVKKAIDKLLTKYPVNNFRLLFNLNSKEIEQELAKHKIMFNPSFHETFSYTTAEALCYMPVICIEEYEWYQHFEDISSGIIPIKLNELHRIKEIYESNIKYDSNLTRNNFITFNKEYEIYFNSYGKKKLTNNKEKFFSNLWMEYSQISLSHYWTHIIKREKINFDDVKTLLRAREFYDLYHTDNGSFLLKPGHTYVEEEKLFSF